MGAICRIKTHCFKTMLFQEALSQRRLSIKHDSMRRQRRVACILLPQKGLRILIKARSLTSLHAKPCTARMGSCRLR